MLTVAGLPTPANAVSAGTTPARMRATSAPTSTAAGEASSRTSANTITTTTIAVTTM